MNDYLKLKKSNCKNCYKCIRHCPVKSIRFTDNQAYIVSEECILCGNCFVSCPQNAKVIKDDIPIAKGLIESGSPVYCSLAPSFVANFDGVTITAMKAALKKLGFADVEETAVGATIVKERYDEIVNNSEQDIIITSCCHTVNLLIEKYYPEALSHLAHVKTPMQAHCSLIKKLHPEAKTVFIGPCISKKAEADENDSAVDCVLTFDNLSTWLAQEGIVLTNIADREEVGGRARFFPTTGGILMSMDCKSDDYTYMSIDGIQNCMNVLSDIVAGNIHKCFIEMSACVGSCIGGPAVEKEKRTPVKDYMAVAAYAKNKDFEHTETTSEEIKKNFVFMGTHNPMPGSTAIEEVLKKMGKSTPEQELNCGSCGYNTCREKAVAVINGKADLSMCLPYLKEKAENFSDNIIHNTPNGIIVLNESFEVQQINKAACKLMNISSNKDILGDQVVRILDPQPFFEVMQNGQNIHNQRVYLAEYKRYVEQTIIYDKGYHIIMSIMRDVTDEEKHRTKREKISKQTIEITDKVVEKQMRVVQEIASLLGETTAETKVALTNLKESLNDE